MNALRRYAFPILAIFVLVTVFGFAATFGGPVHEAAGCPLMSGEAVLCSASILEYLSLWQKAFVAIPAEVLLFLALAVLAVRYPAVMGPPGGNLSLPGKRSHIPEPPTLFQELYSQGILNRKAP